MRTKYMKNKYLGVIAVIVAVVSLVLAVLVLTLINFYPTPAITERAQPARALSAAEQRLISTLESYQAALPTLFAGPSPIAEHDQRFAGMFPVRGREAATAPVFIERNLQMIYRVDGSAVALIDDVLYRVGDALPGGARLEAIGTHSVTVIEAGQRRTIDVQRAPQASVGRGPAAGVHAQS